MPPETVNSADPSFNPLQLMSFTTNEVWRESGAVKLTVSWVTHPDASCTAIKWSPGHRLDIAQICPKVIPPSKE